MRNFWKHIVLFVLAICPTFLVAQVTETDQMIEAIIESRLDKIEPGIDVALIIEDLESLAENPININSTNAAQLSRLYVLDEIQIGKLLDYIETYGPAYSIYELQTIDGLTQDVLLKIHPFIYFGETTSEHRPLKKDLKYGNHQLLLRGLGYLQESKGYKPKEHGTIPFEGNRFRYYTRYNFEVDDRLSFGLTAEKDPGEAFFKGSNKHGFDFYSGHLSFKMKKTFEYVSLGDFIVRAGQGLVIWQGYTSGKSENVLGISKTGQGIRGYTSVEENFHFRGAASTLKVGDGKLSLFYSRKRMDGNLVETDSTETYFTSLQTSGYHRTQNEIDDEKSVTSTNVGGIFTWSFTDLKVGASFVHQQFDNPYYRSNQLYNQYRFSGTENFTGGIDYLLSKGKYQLFGEAALSKSTGFATVQGVVTHLNDQLSFSLLFRHFDKDYHALWANTFAEGSTISNESGLYFGTKFLPAKYLTISAYSDIYQSNWVNYSTAGPVKAWDVFAQADFNFSDKYNFYVRFKNEEKEQKFKENKLYVNLPERTQKIRVHFQYKPSDKVTLKTRFEHVYYKGQNSENGILLFQDVQYSANAFPLNLSARLAYFNTESYNSRIYAYENDILYTFSIPAYFGEGFRTYLNMRYKLSGKTEFWFKLANTHWTDREIIGSGYSEIEGSNKTELKIQLRLKF